MKKHFCRFLKWGLPIVFASFFYPNAAFGQSVTLEAAADTALYENAPNNNLGGVSFMPIGTTRVATRNRGLVRFDLAGRIPGGASITFASLELRVTQISGFSFQDFSAYRMLVQWEEGTKLNGPTGVGSIGALATEGETSWNRRLAPSTSWGTAGGQAGVDYAAAASATVNVGSAGNYRFEGSSMAADVEAWLVDPASNFGWIIMVDNESVGATARRWASREAFSNQPRLTVEFELPLRIDSTEVVGDQILITFQAQAGQSYVLQRRPLADSGEWNIVTNIPPQASSGAVMVMDQIEGTQNYYRVGRE